MKLLFVTGGVISGLGKGITASSIGKIMKSCGYSITMMKLDPYLQIDAGTMSPIEHGETFVTKDGFETDLDLGHYERFINEDLTKQSSVTTGQIYQSVIQQERQGKFLGKTVQVIPHITNEIKDRIKKASTDKDLTIIEIGGTVGDIEGPHFLEAMRQLKQELGHHSVCFVHVVPVLQVTTSGEMKTKAIQHSVIKLREVGLTADILVCRSTETLGESIKRKLSLFCGLRQENIIEALDQPSIYAVPEAFEHQGISTIIQKQIFPDIKPSNLKSRNNKVQKLLHPTKFTTIAIAGKYTDLNDAYISVMESLKHAGVVFDTKINIERINTEKYESETWKKDLQNFINKKNIKGIVVPGGFGGRGIEGKINIATFCRENKLPYLGLCLGLQVATISFARIECKLKNANSRELNGKSEYIVIDIMEDQKNISDKGGTTRLGHFPAKLQEGTLTYKLYSQYGQGLFLDNSKNTVLERHRHRYEVNPKFHQLLKEKGLTLSGLSPDGSLVEFIEYNSEDQYFIATQAHPELQSRLERPHPLFIGLVEASL